jgi:hypothetical protein
MKQNKKTKNKKQNETNLFKADQKEKQRKFVGYTKNHKRVKPTQTSNRSSPLPF